MDTSEFRPPYMSFQTFWGFLEDLASKPLPPRIDRSLMGGKSGTDQANLSAAFASFGLTREDGTVLPALTELVATPADKRKAHFGEIMAPYYSAALEVSAQNGTEADLKRSFVDEWPSIGSADTRRKAITFFLHAARAAELPLSPHFPATRSGSGASGASRAKRTTSKRKTTPAPARAGAAEPIPSPAGPGHSQQVTLRSGGSVTLSYDVSLFDLDGEDQEFVLALIGMVKQYLAAAPAAPNLQAAAASSSKEAEDEG